MGPWLDARIQEVCADNVGKLDELITTNAASRELAAAEA